MNDLEGLFPNELAMGQNLLPYQGDVSYFGKIMSDQEAGRFFKFLLHEIPWESDCVIMFGKRIETKRKVAWYADAPLEYTYSKITKKAQIFNEGLLELKQISEEISGEQYNSCLLNLYHDGSEGMAYHSDGEPDLKPGGAIASLSFGAERKFSFKHKKTGERVDLQLENGSLMVMKGITQKHWFHRLPPTKKIKSARINLTFRTVVK